MFAEFNVRRDFLKIQSTPRDYYIYTEFRVRLYPTRYVLILVLYATISPSVFRVLIRNTAALSSSSTIPSLRLTRCLLYHLSDLSNQGYVVPEMPAFVPNSISPRSIRVRRFCRFANFRRFTANSILLFLNGGTVFLFTASQHYARCPEVESHFVHIAHKTPAKFSIRFSVLYPPQYCTIASLINTNSFLSFSSISIRSITFYTRSFYSIIHFFFFLTYVPMYLWHAH